MRFIVLKCPKCGKHIGFRNYFVWVLHSPMHWFGKRYTKCGYCGKWSWMRKEK